MNITRALIGIVAIALVAVLAWIYVPRPTHFCFDFLHDMYFGESKTLAHPVNTGVVGNRGIQYFPVETKALQTALKNEGYYIDPSEETGGGVYLTAYFGPSTQVALKAFQRKAGLTDTGIVDNETADALTARYGCPKQDNDPATTTPL
ncbi:MAG TPA: peptidoglycan-binding domain-containing protein [Candidatus Paceibacterota bacterium]|jgi:Putative peptidoglycan binding domain.